MKAHQLVSVLIALTMLAVLAVAAGAQAPAKTTTDDCEFDVNDDGNTNIVDVQLVSHCTAMDPCYHPKYNVTWDGVIDVDDIILLGRGWPCERP